MFLHFNLFHSQLLNDEKRKNYALLVGFVVLLLCCSQVCVNLTYPNSEMNTTCLRLHTWTQIFLSEIVIQIGFSGLFFSAWLYLCYHSLCILFLILFENGLLLLQSTDTYWYDRDTQVMAVELGAHKIRVNGISPGLFKSEITEGLMQRQWLANVAKKTVPLRTYGTSDPALTSLVRYLIHESSAYVSGNVFIVDAGATLPGIPIFSSL